MAEVKILLQKGESIDDAEDLLFKALTKKLNPEESFNDPAMIDLSEHVMRIHKQMYVDMIREISDALDAEFSDGNI